MLNDQSCPHLYKRFSKTLPLKVGVEVTFEARFRKSRFSACSEVSTADGSITNLEYKRKWQQNESLQGADLRDAHLSRAHLEGIGLRAAQLQKVQLSWAQMQNTDLFEAQFERVDLEDIDLERAEVEII
jgi:uncharacterized protein YjbI with pentapeptide repeats